MPQPEPHICDPIQLRDTADACHAEFAQCIEQPNGKFCGEGCLGKPIDCSMTDCEYAPAPLSVCEGQRSAHEGRCGDVRYRDEGNGSGGTTSYWSATTGELLAQVQATDFSAYCHGASTEYIDGDASVVLGCEVVIDDTTDLCLPEPDSSCLAAGCGCSRAGLQLCAGGVAMACTDDGPTGPVWALREGVPCDETRTCPEARQRATTDACLAEFRNCDELSDGSFCGGGCYAALDCNTVDCDYKPVSCDGATLYEGLCGDIRYRQSEGLGATSYFWNAANGQLLAWVENTDLPQYCGAAESALQHGDLDVISNCQVVTDATTQICP